MAIATFVLFRWFHQVHRRLVILWLRIIEGGRVDFQNDDYFEMFRSYISRKYTAQFYARIIFDDGLGIIRSGSVGKFKSVLRISIFYSRGDRFFDETRCEGNDDEITKKVVFINREGMWLVLDISVAINSMTVPQV